MQRLATRHIRDIGLVSLAKSDEDPPLPGHVLHRQPRLAPVTPGEPGDWVEQPRRLHRADPAEVVQQGCLFERELLGGIEMLEGTPPADAEDRTPRFDAQRRRLQDLEKLCLVETALLPAADETHRLAGQRAAHEHGLAGRTSDAASIEGRVDDPGRFRLPLASAQSPPPPPCAAESHAARNSRR